MSSVFQSVPIRAIGGRLKNRGHFAPPLGECADRGGWRMTEGADLRREVPSEGLLLWRLVGGRNSPPGSGFPIGETGSPSPPSAPEADGTGNWGKLARGDFLPESFPAILHAWSQLIGISADELLEIRARGPEFQPAPPPPVTPIRLDRGAFAPPTVLNDGGYSPPPIPPLFRRPPWAASSIPPIRKSGEPGSRGTPSARAPMGCRFGGPSLGEIGSPRPGGVPRAISMRSIGDLANATGWEKRVSKPCCSHPPSTPGQ